MNKKCSFHINLTLNLFIALMMLCTTLFSQNNPYKINDKLFPTFSSLSKNIRKKGTDIFIESFLEDARKEGDVKAQCLAYTLKVQYYVHQSDILKAKDALITSRNFVIKTPYKQYIFSGWNSIISYYLKVNDHESAMNETKEYQKVALEMKNSYGISFSYRQLSRIYYSINMHEQGNEMLEKGAEYLLGTGDTKELDQFYTPLAVYYFEKGEDEKAKRYFELAKKYNIDYTRMLSININMFSIYSKHKELDKAEAYYKLVQNDIKKYGKPVNSIDTYYKAMMNYSILKGWKDKVVAYADSITTPLKRYENLVVAHKYLGNYKDAFNVFSKLKHISDSILDEKNTQVIFRTTQEYNNQKLEMEKRELTLQNTQMRLNRSEEQRHLLEMGKEHDSLLQNNTLLELRNRNLKLSQQQQNIKQQEQQLLIQKQRADTLELKDRNKRNLLMMIIFLFVFIIVSFLLIYLNRLKYIKKLQEEKMIAVDAQKRAEKADNLKSLFLQNVSHEIRTPLNAIVGFTEILTGEMASELSDDEKEGATNLIKTNSNILTTLINDILDLSKMESGTYKIELTEVNVDKICNNVFSSISTMVKPGVNLVRGANWNVNKNESMRLVTDSSRLHQVLTNFLSNACKNTDQGSITLDYTMVSIDKKSFIRFTVTDTGCGIPPDKAEAIFSRFEKLNSFKQGTGLGLNICQMIARMLHANIYLDTEYKQGACFVFEHPVE